MEPAEVITNVTFPVHCRAEGRVFHTAGVLLEHNDTNRRWLPRQMWLCRTAVWVYKGLMKTWQPSRLKSILWGSRLMHIQANLRMSTLLMVWGMLGWKVFTWKTKPNPSGQVHRLGVWEMEQRCGREVGRRREACIWKMSRWLLPSWGWSGPGTERWLSQLLGAHTLFFLAMG